MNHKQSVGKFWRDEIIYLAAKEKIIIFFKGEDKSYFLYLPLIATSPSVTVIITHHMLNI